MSEEKPYYGYCTRCDEWHNGKPLCPSSSDLEDEKIKSLESKLAEKEFANKELAQMVVNWSGDNLNLEKKFSVAVEMLEGASVSMEYITETLTGEVSEYANGCAVILRNTLKQLSEQ